MLLGFTITSLRGFFDNINRSKFALVEQEFSGNHAGIENHSTGAIFWKDW